MRYVLILSLAFGLSSCNSKPQPAINLNALSGYWQISMVKDLNNNTKNYGLAQAIDYFELHQDKGFRKKVYPKFDGSYQTNKDALPFTVLKTTNGDLFLNFNNNNSFWREQIMALDSTNLALKDAANFTYYYQRFTPMKLAP